MSDTTIIKQARPPHSRRQRVAALGLTVAVAVACPDVAAAFPSVDLANLDPVPVGTDLATPDAQDLRHQLQLANGISAPAGGGWTFVPRIDAQEMLTDNVFQAHSPRQYDVVSYFAPGFSIAGNTPRLNMSLQYAPTLSIYARSSSLNALTQQLNGIGDVTLIPELAFLDIRALSGVQNAFGGIGGLGTVGSSAGAASSGSSGLGSLGGGGQGLTRQNEVQSSSINISPYLMRKFADIGTGRVGYSSTISRSAQLSGFASSPLPSGGMNGQTVTTNEETINFVTGDILDRFQDTFDADVTQSAFETQAGSVNSFTGAAAPTTTHGTSKRDIVSNKISYAFSHAVMLFASGGYENISYSNGAAQPINDMTWSIGTTLSPTQESRLTVSYGHQNGYDSLSADGSLPLSARTLLNLSYGHTLGTHLENLRNQLNLATISSSGTSGANGSNLFGTTNAQPLQNGVFRTDTLTIGTQTVLDRDVFSINLLLSKQTTQSAASSSADSKTFNITWMRQMRPDMTVNAAFSYAVQSQAVSTGLNPGNNVSLAASLGGQWQISDSVGASLRYSLLERHAAVASFNIYQNMLILGVSKTF